MISNQTLHLLMTASLLFSCRSREDSTVQSGEASSESKFSGRVAVFDIYDKTTKSTRQAPGIMVATRGALISGLKPEETVTLNDDQRKGQRYFPLNIADANLTFVGLEAPSNAVLALAPVSAVLPPLSAQAYAPLSMRSRLEAAPSGGPRVIMYNEHGYVLGHAYARNGIVNMYVNDYPRAYPPGGYLAAFLSLFVEEKSIPPLPLSHEKAMRMMGKGGPIIFAEPQVKYAGIIETNNRWKFLLRGPEQPATVDIIAYVGEDPRNRTALGFFQRKDLLPEAIGKALDRAAVKFSLPAELGLELGQFLDCKGPG